MEGRSTRLSVARDTMIYGVHVRTSRSCNRGDPMNDEVVQLDGETVTIRKASLPLDELRLDEANPRVQYQIDTSLDGKVTQDGLAFALVVANDQYDKLLEHIERNNGLVNPIWVAPYPSGGYLVIEGNTRTQIYRDLRDKYPHREEWSTIPAYVLPHNFTRDQVHFIRLEAHMFGATPWDAYEKANYLYKLNVEEDYSLDRLAKLQKLSASEIRMQIQAFRDMKEQYLERFQAPEEHQKFSYFVEFRKNADLRRLVEAGELNVVDFANWVGEGKFTRGEEVRRLGEILKDTDAKEAFLAEGFAAGLDQLAVRDPGAKSPLFDKISDVVIGLNQLPFRETDQMRSGLAPAKVARLEELRDAVNAALDGVR